MFKKTITYVDFNGVTRTEDFYFNLMKSELTKLQIGAQESMTDFLERIVNAKDIPQIMKVMDQIILMSYGEKSEDGRLFMKSEEIRQRFASSPAYDQIYMSFLSENGDESAKNMSDFINGIMPADVKSALDEAKSNGTAKLLTNA